jgi:hypothetical protein
MRNSVTSPSVIAAIEDQTGRKVHLVDQRGSYPKRTYRVYFSDAVDCRDYEMVTLPPRPRKKHPRLTGTDNSEPPDSKEAGKDQN